MKILLITKYPPIEGGVSSQSYRLARSLGQKGHEVFVITNANEVEAEYREKLLDSELSNLEPENVHVFNTDLSIEMNPMHIPTSKAYAERLASQAIEVIRRHDIDVIDSYYLLPYGVAAFMAKTVTRRPLVVRHAGSDINRLFSSSSYRTLFISIFEHADRIVTYSDTRKKLVELGIEESKLVKVSKIYIDTTEFNPVVEPLELAEYDSKLGDGKPIITYIGKIPYYWESKGIGELVEAASRVKEGFTLLFCSNGTGKNRFIQVVKKKDMENRVVFIDFLPPWLVPRLIKASTCIVIPERDFPVKNHVSNIPLEAMAVGKCMIISKEVHSREPYLNLVNDESALIIDPLDIKQFRKALQVVVTDARLVEKVGKSAFRLSESINHFSMNVDITLQMYNRLLSGVVSEKS